MTPQPNGLLRPGARGTDLVLTRSFKAGIDDVWASITEPERVARWFGTWTGDAAPGRTILFTAAEEGAVASDMSIDACEPPRHLAVTTIDAAGTWPVEAHLEESDGVTVLTFTHHLDDDADPGSVGPGWEYYLDRLVASREGDPMPDFDDYYPAQKAYYEGLPSPGARS